jgi:hypothetical protein
MMRRSWPTMTLTFVALLAVVGVLVITGSSRSRGGNFMLSATPSTQAVLAGGAAQFRIEVSSNGRFTGPVELSTTGVPDGIVISLSPHSVVLSKAQPSAIVELELSTLPTTTTGTFQLGLLARGGNHLQTSMLNLQIEPASITDAEPPPPLPVTGSGAEAFAVTGTLHGSLQPGATLPLELRIGNPNRQALVVSKLTVVLVSTSRPACKTSNFSIKPYSGTGPLRLPAGQHRTLDQLGVPASAWPQLSMLNLATNQDACKGVTLNLRYTGIGSAG